MLNNNARRYYRERLENALGKIGHRGDTLGELTSSLLTMIGNLPEHRQIPDGFFDLARSARIIARQEQKTPEHIQSKLSDHLSGLFDIHDLPVQAPAPKPRAKAAAGGTPPPPALPRNIGRETNRRKLLPSDTAIVRAALAFRAQHGQLPAAKDKGAQLPQGSIGWGALGRELQKRGTTLGKLVAAHQAIPYENAVGRKAQPLPADEAIVRAALAFRAKHGRIPTPNDKHAELPEGSIGWGALGRALKKRGTTLGKLVKEAGNRAAAPEQETPSGSKPEKTAPDGMPSPIAAPLIAPPCPNAALNGAAPTGAAPVNIAANGAVPLDPAPVNAASIDVSALDAAAIDAARIFADAARFIKKNRALPSPRVFHHFVGGRQVGELNRLFAGGQVGGWERFVPDGTPAPRSLDDFMVSARLALGCRQPLKPASAQAVRALERKHGL